MSDHSDRELKFRWVKVHAGWWECPRHRLSVVRDAKTKKWRELSAAKTEYETAQEAMAGREAQFIKAARKKLEEIAEMEAADMRYK